MGSSRKYTGIKDAVDDIQSKPDYEGPESVLSEVPTEKTVIQWTNSLTGFEAGTTVSGEAKTRLNEIDSLFRDSELRLENHASDIGVRSLNEFSPESVLFMACIRELQEQYAGKANLNPHKFSVLQGGRYSVK